MCRLHWHWHFFVVHLRTNLTDKSLFKLSPKSELRKSMCACETRSLYILSVRRNLQLMPHNCVSVNHWVEPVCVLVRLLFLIFALKLHRSLHWHIVVELSIATFSTWNIYCRFSNWSHFLVDSQYGASMKSRVVCVVANNNIQSILFLMSAHKSNRFWIHVQSSLARSLTQRIDIQPKMPLKIIRTKKVLNKFKTAHSIYVRQLTKQTVRGSNQTDL